MTKVEIGNATLYLGDARDILPTLEPVGAVITDPPYGIGWKRGENKARNSKAHEGIQNDEDTSARDQVLGLMNCPALVFGSFYAPFPEDLKQVLVWRKPPDSGLVGSVTGFRRDCEPLFLVGKWPTRTVEESSLFVTNRGQASIVSETGHPHTKPLELMQTLVKLAPPGVILDPFMGSGTTGVACAKLGRKFIGIEIDPLYFETACKRIEAVEAQPDMFINQPPGPEQPGLL